mmetsp:Transcript_4613/g.9255  ORF Transcript_4613/g.9255 Transcript_4613/m.9255 type:complete len:85 (+) Transcript_4613:187-441(+)
MNSGPLLTFSAAVTFVVAERWLKLVCVCVCTCVCRGLFFFIHFFEKQAKRSSSPDRKRPRKISRLAFLEDLSPSLSLLPLSLSH